MVTVHPFDVQRLRPKLLLPLGGAILSLLIVGSVAWFIAASREAALKDAGHELQQLALALSEATERGFDSATVIQNSMLERMQTMGVNSSEDLGRLMNTAEIRQLMIEKISGAPLVDAMSLLNAEGKVINFTRTWPIRDINSADRDYFEALAKDSKLDFFVGKTIRNRGNGTWSICLARRINGPGRRFAGILLVLINASYFENVYSSFEMPGGRITLYRTNGVPMARFPHLDSEYSRSYASLPIFGDKRGPEKAGILTITSLGDGLGTRRLLAFNEMKQYPAVVTVSKSVLAALSEWRNLSKILCAVTAAMILLIMTVVVCLLRALNQQRVSTEKELSAQRAIAQHAGRFEIAMNNMLHGLSMFDADDRLIVCNGRYAEIYALPARLTQPGTSGGDVFAHVSATFGIPVSVLKRATPQNKTSISSAGEGTALRHLNDGRTILIRSRLMADGGCVRIHEDVTARQKTEGQLSYLARHDTLTGLFNRHVFQERLDQALALAALGASFAVLCIDLDYFKEINDLLGHSTGDLLLKEVAGRLNSLVRESDTVARIGGDEFAIIQATALRPEDTANLARRVVGILSEPYEIDGQKINICASAGIAVAPRDDIDGTRLLGKADMALYRAKSEGRRSFRFFEPGMDSKLQARRSLEMDLRLALERDEIELCYQPLVDARTQKITSFEALLRWNHPHFGLVPPGDFIPIAEDTGLIISLGAWVLKTACQQAMTWPKDVLVSVNVSVKQFRPGDLVETISQVLADTGLAPGRLELEITESVLLNEEDDNLATLHALRNLGVKIVMDDFGTGYSSLNYLRVFPFDKIKIDKSFIQNLDQASASAIVSTIAQLGRILGMRMTAEGIETQEQLEKIIEQGFSEGQGYLFSHPVCAAEVPALLGAPVARRHAA
jgi:diguanylate cyclase (GGDEF)-like protein